MVDLCRVGIKEPCALLDTLDASRLAWPPLRSVPSRTSLPDVHVDHDVPVWLKQRRCRASRVRALVCSGRGIDSSRPTACDRGAEIQEASGDRTLVRDPATRGRARTSRARRARSPHASPPASSTRPHRESAVLIGYGQAARHLPDGPLTPLGRIADTNEQRLHDLPLHMTPNTRTRPFQSGRHRRVWVGTPAHPIMGAMLRPSRWLQTWSGFQSWPTTGRRSQRPSYSQRRQASSPRGLW